MSQAPRKRMRLASDCDEYVELKVAETANNIGEEDVLSLQAILLVETTNGSTDKEAMAVVKAYDLHEKKSRVLTPVTAEMIIGGLCILQLYDEVYMFVREGRLFCLKDFWLEMCSTMDFHDVPAVEMDGFFYVLGSEKERNGTCEKYDPRTNRWHRIGITYRNSNFCCSVALQGWIYAIGYRSSNIGISNVEKFHPDTKVWKNVASTEVVRGSMVATTLNGEIYVAGKNQENFSVIEIYNPIQDVWTLAATSHLSHSYYGLFTVDQTLLAIGRNFWYTPCSTGVEIATLDFEKRKWVKAATFENCTLDPHPALCCTLRPVGNYMAAVEVEKETIVCPLVKLTEKSDYFKAMFTHQFQEKKEGKVVLRDMDSAAVKLCIRHIFEEYFPDEFDVINFSDSLFYVARMFLLDELVSFLMDYCAGKLSLANFPVLRVVSYKYDLTLLEEKCDRFAKENLKEIVEHDCFTTMEVDYVKHLLQWRKQKVASCVRRCRWYFIKGTSDCGLTETDLMRAVLSWVKYDEKVRERFLSEHLLAEIDLSKVRLDTLKEAAGEPLIKVNQKALRKFQNAIKKRRRAHLVLLHRKLSTGEFHAYFPTERKWRQTRLPPHSARGNVMHCFNIENKLYLVDAQKRLYSITFSDSIGSWQEKSALPLIGENLVFATVDSGHLYAFGKNKAAKYDPRADSWSVIDFSESRTDFAVVAYQDSIYIIGGRKQQEGENAGSDNLLSTVLCMKTATEQWLGDVASMMEARFSLAAAQCSGKIFAIGGRGKFGWCAVTEEYDPVLNLWSRVASMKRTMSCLKAVTVGQQIFVFSRSFTLTYHPNCDTWTRKRIRGDFDQFGAVCASMPYDMVED